MVKRFYFLVVHGDVEPELSMPFQTKVIRDSCAAEARRADPELKNGIYWMDVTDVHKIKIGPYSAKWDLSALGKCPDCCGNTKCCPGHNHV